MCMPVVPALLSRRFEAWEFLRQSHGGHVKPESAAWHAAKHDRQGFTALCCIEDCSVHEPGPPTQMMRKYFWRILLQCLVWLLLASNNSDCATRTCSPSSNNQQPSRLRRNNLRVHQQTLRPAACAACADLRWCMPTLAAASAAASDADLVGRGANAELRALES